MFKRICALVMFLLMVMVMVGSAHAFPIVEGDTVQMNAAEGDNYGITVDNSNVYYNTFCLEVDKYFTNDTDYFVESVGFVAVSGGNNTGSTEDINGLNTYGDATSKAGDPISEETIWLYASYFDGMFNSFYKTDAELVSAVQNVIWYSEDEIEGAGNLSIYDYFIKDAKGDFSVEGWDIQVVNLINKENNSDIQSQLVGVRTAPVPEPATMMLFGVGLLGLAGVNRKQKNR